MSMEIPKHKIIFITEFPSHIGFHPLYLLIFCVVFLFFFPLHSTGRCMLLPVMDLRL